MQRKLGSLDAVLQGHRRLVLAVWALLLLAAMPLAAMQSQHLTGGGFTDPSSASGAVERALPQLPGAGGPSLSLVLVRQPGADPGDVRRAIVAATRSASDVDGVSVPASSRRAALLGASVFSMGDVVVPLVVDGGEPRSIDAAKSLRSSLGITSRHAGELAGGGVQVNVVGQGGVWASVQERTEKDVATAEARGFPIIAIVLLVAFGSLVAAMLPLALGLTSVVVTGGLIYLLSLGTEMSVFVTSVASMLGIGVAVDYSLFVLVRYREEIAGGRSKEDARAVALSTSGLAVAFSGLTVIAALAGLYLIDSTALRSIASGAILVVAVAVLGALTLLPVLISLIDRPGRPSRLARGLRRGSGTRQARFWPRWSAAVTRRPVASLLAASAVLLLLAAPVARLHIENPGIEQLGADDPLRAGVAAAATVAGPGALGPVQVVVEPHAGTLGDKPVERLVSDLAATAAKDPLVQEVSEPVTAASGRRILLTATLRRQPSSASARAAVDRLRAGLAREAGTAATVRVGGTTAVLKDFDDLIKDSMWKIIVFVLAVSFVVLLVLLRSPVLALKAVLMTLMSVLAAYGVLVAVFQWGWLGFLGLPQSPYIDTLTPPLVLVIAFGLSMDYQVFLLSRIRERYAATGDTRLAVSQGLASSGRTISSAALVMVAVFLAFVSAGLPSVQRLGLCLAVAIALDATLVRLVLVPAAIVLLGRWNWWMPRPLARIVPGRGIYVPALPGPVAHPGDQTTQRRR